MNQSDLKLLKETVNIVFHSAATVRFDQGIKEAVTLNTLGSKRLWDLCLEMPNLKSIIHVSTAYTNPARSDVGEAVYPSRVSMDNDTFIKCANVLPDELVALIAAELQVNSFFWSIQLNIVTDLFSSRSRENIRTRTHLQNQLPNKLLLIITSNCQ